MYYKLCVYVQSLIFKWWVTDREQKKKRCDVRCTNHEEADCFPNEGREVIESEWKEGK